MVKHQDESTSGQAGSLASHSLFPAGQIVPFVLVTVLFFLWGVPNNLNDVLIRHFMKSFAISRFQAGLVQSAFYMGYFLLAIPAALMMKRVGYKAGFVVGLLLFAAGAFLFWPAALASSYAFFLFALFVIASGLSFLETASNPFIAQLGDPDSSERRLNFSQAFNPLGAITGALIGTIFIFSGVELTPQEIAARQAVNTYEAYLRFETLRVVRPYLVIGVVAVIWALLILRTKFPVIASESESGSDYGKHSSFLQLFKERHFLLAVVAQFFYVGAQVGTWSYFISYVQEYAHQPEKIAGYFLTGTLAAFGVGRFVSAYLMRFLSPSRLMGAYAIANIVLVSVGVLQPGWVGVWCVFLTSFFMSLMFPTIFALGLKGLGPNTKIGGSFLVMAIVGGAVLTPLMGLVSEKFHSLALSYSIPLIAYVYICAYSFWGSRRVQLSPAIGEPAGNSIRA
jgi:FHS family L-fucose permease-like MFS transporter